MMDCLLDIFYLAGRLLVLARYIYCDSGSLWTNLRPFTKFVGMICEFCWNNYKKN